MVLGIHHTQQTLKMNEEYIDLVLVNHLVINLTLLIQVALYVNVLIKNIIFFRKRAIK